jgi:hypothetical protein
MFLAGSLLAGFARLSKSQRNALELMAREELNVMFRTFLLLHCDSGSIDLTVDDDDGRLKLSHSVFRNRHALTN